MENENMAWRENLSGAILEVKSVMAGPAGSKRDAAIRQSRMDAAGILEAHPALKDWLPTSDRWALQMPGLGIPFNTERLLSKLIDGLFDSVERAGIERAVRDCDELLTAARDAQLPGYELTFFDGLKVSGRWNLAPGLYVAPYETARKQLSGGLGLRYDPFELPLEPEETKSLTALVRKFRWGLVIGSSTARTGSTLSDPSLNEITPTFNHDPMLLVALLSATLRLPLPVRAQTRVAAPWVESFLDFASGITTHSAWATVFLARPPREVSADARRASEQAFGKWSSFSGSDRDALALAATRLSASLSRRGPLAAQDRVLDISIALEILYRLDPGEITFKLSSRAGWYLGSDTEERLRIRKVVRDFYDLRSAIAHGRVSRTTRRKLDPEETRDEAFKIARATLLKHLERQAMPSHKDWSDIIMGAS